MGVVCQGLGEPQLGPEAGPVGRLEASGEGVDGRLGLLEAGEVGAAFIVEREDGLGLRRETAALEALVEGVRVFADPFDVEH